MMYALLTVLQSSIFLRLLLAHIVGDFVLQTDKMCDNKREEKKCEQFKAQLLHGGIHAILAFVALGSTNYWYVALGLGVLHIVTDILKVAIERKKMNKAVLFGLDQIVHIIIVWVAAKAAINCELWFGISLSKGSLIIIMSYLLMLKPAAIAIGWILSLFKLDEVKKNNKTLEHAGRWIGYCERLMALSFMLIGCYEALGFLMAAKSIFRFGDLKNKPETTLTEYVLLGTLLSMTAAVAVGLLCSNIIPLI